MKTNTHNFFLELTMIAAQFVVAMIIAFAFSHYHFNLYYFQWAITGTLIYLLFKNNKPSTPTTASQRYNAWFNIIALQLLLFATFYGISNYFGAHTFVQVIRYNTTHLGLAPWSVMLLVAYALRLLLHRTHKDATFVDALRSFFKIKHGGTSWSLINLCIRSCTNAIIGITLALLCLGVISAMVGSLTNFSLLTIIISFIVALCALIKKFQVIYKWLVKNKHYLYLYLPLFAVISGVIISLLALLLSPIAHVQTQTPGIITIINYCYKLSITPLLFGQSWWLAWSVVGGIFIAHKSRHISSCEMLIIGAILPIMVYLLIAHTSSSALLITHRWSIIIGIFGCLGLFKLLFQKDMLPATILNYLPATTQPRQRSHHAYMRRVIKGCLMVLFFAIPIGMQIPALFASFAALPVILLSVGLLIYVLKTIY